METLLIDGFEADSNERIGVTFQSYDLSSQTKIKEAFTYSIKLPKTDKNRKILGYPDEIGIDYDLNDTLREKKGSITSEGVPLLDSGNIMFSSSSEGFEINVYGDAVDFWELIKDKSIRDFYWTGIEGKRFGVDAGYPTHSPGQFLVYPNIETWKSPTYTTASNGTMNLTKGGGTILNNKYLVPFVKKKTILETIIEGAGYVFDDSDMGVHGQGFSRSYNNSYISLQVPVGKAANDVDQDIYVKDWMHDISHEDFIKGMLYQYGCFLVVKGKTVYLKSWKRMIDQKGSALNWSGKMDLSVDPSISYNSGYAKSNRWDYLNYDPAQINFLNQLIANNPTKDPIAYLSSEKGWVESSYKNLDDHRLVGIIPWQPILQFKIKNGDGNYRQIAFLPCWHSGNNEFSETYPPVDIVLPDDPTTYNDSGGTPEVWSIGSQVANGDVYTAWHSEQEPSTIHLSNSDEPHGLGFDVRLIPQYYNEGITAFIRQPLVVTAKFNLSVPDIYEWLNKGDDGLEKYLPVYIEKLNGYYHVNKISNYISGRPVEVELIRI